LVEARKFLDEVTVRGEKSKAEADLLRREIEWLVKFKSGLLTDLATFGYTGPMRKGAGPVIGTGSWTANDQGVEIHGSNVKFQVTWPEIAPEIVLAAAESFLRPALGVEGLADRKWRLGIYLLMLRREAEARTRLAEASAVKAEYRDALAQLRLQ
jgi:hypothetical protein